MRINSITQSVHGELPYIGSPCVIIRLADCNLKCPYCDTFFAFKEALTVKEVEQQIEKSYIYDVLITGGEPLLQMGEVQSLLEMLRDMTLIRVVIETNGSIPLEYMHRHPAQDLCISMDLKPLSIYKRDELHQIALNNLQLLREEDILKIVFQSFEQVDAFIQSVIHKRLPLPVYPKIVFSPADYLLQGDKGDMSKCVDKIIEFSKEVINEVAVQVQIHKLLGVS